MANENLVLVTKCWNDRDGNYGEKDFYFNPSFPVLGIEPCKLKKDGVSVDCTKVLYAEGKFTTIAGTPPELFDNCQKTGVSICVINDLYKAGITIKQFIMQIEGLNGINL